MLHDLECNLVQDCCCLRAKMYLMIGLWVCLVLYLRSIEVLPVEVSI